MAKRAIVPLIAMVMALAAALGGATPAYAHAIIVRADPPDGASLSVAPQQMRLWFSEPVALNFTTLELVDGDGRRIPVTAHSDAASLAVAVRSGEAAGAVLVVVDLPRLAPNVYRLNWRTLSNNDLHNTSGSIVFGVRRPADRAPAVVTAPAPAPLEVALRWLNFGAVAALLGALAIALLATDDRPFAAAQGRRPTTDDRRTTDHGPQATRNMRSRLLRLAFWSGLLALVVGIGLLLFQAATLREASGRNLSANVWEIISGTSYGTRWLLRQGVLAILVAIVRLLHRTGQVLPRTSHAEMVPPPAVFPPPHTVSLPPSAVPPPSHAVPTPSHAMPMLKIAGERRGRRHAVPAAVVALALALAVAQALQGHATAFNAFAPVRVVVDTLHLLAASLWAGGVLALAVAVVPLLRRDADDAALAWAILRRFGVLAAASLAALLVTGLFMSGQQVASLDALLTTLYGQALLLKVALALGVALIGLLNAAALHPRVAAPLRWLLRRPAGWAPFASRSLARTVALEAAGALLVLLLAATLSATQPARGPEFDPPAAEAASPAVTTNADDLVVTLAVKPNRPGQNFIGLGVFNTRRPAPAPIERVAVRLLPPAGQPEVGPLAAEPIGTGRYQIAGDSINIAGGWAIAVTVARPGLPDTTATVAWTVLPPAPPLRPVLVSNRPLEPWTTGAALLVTLLLGGTLITFQTWRRRALYLARARSFVAARRLHPLRKE